MRNPGPVPASPEQRIQELERGIDQLSSREDIRQVLYLYARGVDRSDLELLNRAFHADGTEVHSNSFIGSSRDFTTWLVGWPSKLPLNRHTVTNAIIELRDDRAFVESQYDGLHRFPLDDGGAVDRQAQGRYLDIFERREGQWRILHRRVVVERTWVTVLSAEDLVGVPDLSRPPRLEGLAPGRAPDDPVYRGFGIADINGDPFAARDPAEIVRATFASRS